MAACANVHNALAKFKPLLQLSLPLSRAGACALCTGPRSSCTHLENPRKIQMEFKARKDTSEGA